MFKTKEDQKNTFQNNDVIKKPKNKFKNHSKISNAPLIKKTKKEAPKEVYFSPMSSNDDFVNDLHKSIIADAFLGKNISNEKKALVNQVIRMIKNWSKYDKLAILNECSHKQSSFIPFDKRVAICLISTRSVYEINRLLSNYSKY
jgi:hypothetical protein